MNILFWAGGVSTTVHGTTLHSYTTSDTYKNPNIFDARGVVWGSTTAAKTINFVEQADVYLSFQYAVDRVSGYYSTDNIVLLEDLVRVNSNTSEDMILYINEAGSWVNKGTIGTNDLNVRFDIIFERAVSGKLEVWIDGAMQAQYLGDTTTGDYPATTSSIILGVSEGLSTDVSYVSAFFQADEPTLGVEAVQSAITANGTHTDWDGSDYDKINNLGLDDTTLISSKVVGEKSTFTTDDIPAAFSVGYDVVAVGVGVRASTGGVSSPDLALMIKDGANEVESSTITMDGTKAPRIGIFHTAPDAGAWDVSKVNSAEYGVVTK